MTLPPFMFTNRDNLRKIEADVVLTLCDMVTAAKQPIETPSSFDYSQDEAADIVDASLGGSFLDTFDFCKAVTPPSSPSPTPEIEASAEIAKNETKKKATKTKRKKAARKAKKKSSATKSSRPASAPSAAPVRRAPPCSIPTRRDPTDPSFRTTLYTSRDDGRINPVHVAVRREVLEVRRAESGRVFFQCAHCARLKDSAGCAPKDSKIAKQSTISPQRLERLYRGMVRFMMEHVPNCEHIPVEIREMNATALRLKKKKQGSMKAYWAENARAVGLRDDPERKCIVVDPAYVPAYVQDN